MAQENYGKRIWELLERLAAKVGVGDMRDGQEDLESLNKRLGRFEAKAHRLLEIAEEQEKKMERILEMMEGADKDEGLG